MSRPVTYLVAAFLLAASARAQETNAATKAPGGETISRRDVQAISVQHPPADSPFFIERQEARDAMASAGREGYGMYVPKPPSPPVGQQVKSFFRGLFGHGRKDSPKDGPEPMALTIAPADFSLGQTPELDVSLRVSNARKREIELLFPDNQRLEILTKDSSGKVVSRWSEDRTFEAQQGFTEINPDEYVLYAERIPTTRMKAGETYTIEASLANQEGYTATATVKPRP